MIQGDAYELDDLLNRRLCVPRANSQRRRDDHRNRRFPFDCTGRISARRPGHRIPGNHHGAGNPVPAVVAVADRVVLHVRAVRHGSNRGCLHRQRPCGGERAARHRRDRHADQ